MLRLQREKVSNGDQEFENIDDAMEDIPEQDLDFYDDDEEVTLPHEENEDE